MSDIVAAVDDPHDPGAAWAVARDLAAATGRTARLLHVEVGHEGEAADDVDAVVEAIVDRVSPGELLVVESEHATRWSGKYSVSEGLVDHRPGSTMIVGPQHETSEPAGGPGPIVVALDGSDDARAAVGPALALAAAYSVGVQLTRVITRAAAAGLVDRSADADAKDRSARDAVAAADELASLVGALAVDQIGQADHPPVTARLLVSNDHVAALVDEAAMRSSPFVVVASRGDRTVARSTISRTSSGLAAEAPCPVLVISPEA